ncbi:SAC9 [Acrasis kona]|uniref:SAC9 n=1 Tax=Acrasis kona TaxID=1008807 RepID=A0AAW2YMW0_9EUKA
MPSKEFQGQAFLNQSRKKNTDGRRKCFGLIGYYVVGNLAHVVAVTRISLELMLPPKHRVYTVMEAKWIKIPIEHRCDVDAKTKKNMAIMTEFQIDGNHFYCETLDLSRTFPSTHPAHEPCEEFVWNTFVTKPFADIGMSRWCVVLLQGVAMGRVVPTDDDKAPLGIHLALICRRSSINPGTRYFSRGLNEKSSPGNECEMEQIVFKQADDSVCFSTAVWRRGTVPIHWKSELVSQIADAAIIISDRPYEAIDVYYKRLADRYQNQPITVLNLLRVKSVHADEGNLTHHYRESLRAVKKMFNVKVDMVEFDWHHFLKLHGIEETTEALWDLTDPITNNAGLTTGVLHMSNGRFTDMTVQSKQNGILRVNCADSLDRTNLVCFFNSLHYLRNQCYAIDAASLAPKSPTASLEEIKKEMDANLLVHLTDMYIMVGDVCATLYTNTVAMHTQHMRDMTAHVTTAPSNAAILVNRRIQNQFKDKTRQKQYDIMLGINLKKYFTFSDVKYVCSNAYMFKSVPSYLDKPHRRPEDEIISNSNLCMVAPEDFDYIEIHIFLPNYFRLLEVSMVIRHGQDDTTSPSRMDVFCGTHLDDCVMAYQDLILPRCEDGTKLTFTLPPQISGLKQRNTLYDFEELTTSTHMRVVRVVCYGIAPGSCMTLGQIQVYGTDGRKALIDDVQLGVDRVTRIVANIQDEQTATSPSGDQEKNSTSLPVNNVTPIDNNYFAHVTGGDVLFSSIEDQIATTQDQRDVYVLELHRITDLNSLSFNDVLRLEMIRLKCGLSTSQRDTILIESGYKVAHYDPNNYVFWRDPKIENTIRGKLKSWNCNICRTSIKLRNIGCRYCRLSFCKNCIHNEKLDVIEYMWLFNPSTVCLDCAVRINEQRDLICEIQRLSQDRHVNNETVNEKLFDKNLMPNLDRIFHSPNHQETLLSEFPHAGILSSVATAQTSAPIESILLQEPQHYQDGINFWSSPVGIESVHIIVVLPCYAKINKITLLVDALGYNDQDKPTIRVSLGERLPLLTFMGEWQLPDGTISAHDRIDWDVSDLLTGYDMCRLVQFEVKIPKETKNNNFIHLGRFYIYGQINAAPASSPLNQKQLIQYERVINKKKKSSRVTIKTESKFYRQTSTLDLIIGQGVRVVSGFKILVSHGEQGSLSQVKDLRVGFLTENDRKELISQQVIGTYIIPKVANNTSLEFEFEKNYDNVKIIRFEFLSNYGADMIEVSHGRVSLFFTQPN